jgi:hypothetical protein
VTIESDPVKLVSCEARGSWLQHQKAALMMAIVAGLVMLVGSLVALNSASVRLLVLGGALLFMGPQGARQYSRTVRTMTFDGTQVRFALARGHHDVALRDITEFTWAKFDLNRLGALRTVTTDGTYLVAARPVA